RPRSSSVSRSRSDFPRVDCSDDRLDRLPRPTNTTKPMLPATVDGVKPSNEQRSHDMADKGANSKKALVDALNGARADHLALYMKSKNFQWHASAPRFRDPPLLFEDQATRILGLVDIIAERVRKNDAPTLTSIGSISAASNIADQDGKLDADAMIKELRDDNRKLLERLREVKETSEEAGDNATNGLVDDWIDEAEERVWFLSETLR